MNIIYLVIYISCHSIIGLLMHHMFSYQLTSNIQSHSYRCTRWAPQIPPYVIYALVLC